MLFISIIVSLRLALIQVAYMGLNMGVIDCVVNVAVIRLYGRDVSPFLQVCDTMYDCTIYMHCVHFNSKYQKQLGSFSATFTSRLLYIFRHSLYN